MKDLDAKFFKANPKRMFHIRPPQPGELSNNFQGLLDAAPEGWIKRVVSHQVHNPGFHGQTKIVRIAQAFENKNGVWEDTDEAIGPKFHQLMVEAAKELGVPIKAMH